MNVSWFLHGPVDAAQKAEELLGAVTWHAFPDEQARFDGRRGEERGCAMALVDVGHRGCPPLRERQTRLCPIKRLKRFHFMLKHIRQHEGSSSIPAG